MRLHETAGEPLAKAMTAGAIEELALHAAALKVRGYKTTAEDIAAALRIPVPAGVAMDFPDWLKTKVADELDRIFKQPYWQGISKTTRNDVAGTLEDGLLNGWSIRRMAADIESRHGAQYTRARATNVARTESTNALNAGHAFGIERVSAETGMAMVKEWLSVLGTTTRDSHAALDGVQSDAQGMFDLNGYRIPWPAHSSLPPHDRCSCQCTTISAFVGEAVEPDSEAATPRESMESSGLTGGEMEPVNTGVNETFFGDLEDGTRVVFKPARGERSYDREVYEAGTLYHREVAASKLDEILGFDIVPTTVVKRHDEYGVGSAQAFVEDAKDGNAYTSKERNKLPTEERQKLIVLDFIAGNPDRHAGNYLLSEDVQTVYAIDNGYAFPDNSKARVKYVQSNGNERLIERVEVVRAFPPGDAVILPEIVDSVRSAMERQDEIRAALSPHISKAEIDSLFQRMEWVVEHADNAFTATNWNDFIQTIPPEVVHLDFNIN